MIKRAATFVAAMVFVLAAAQAFAQGRLQSPWDQRTPALTNQPYRCPALVHLSPNLTTDGFYGDSKGSVIDPAKLKAYNESSGPYKELGNQAVAAADAYRTTGSRAAAQCVISLLNGAVADGVFAGKMSSTQAYFVQGWVAGALAISYLKVRDTGLVSGHDTQKIADYLKTVANQTLNFYEGRTPFTGGWKTNNHLYWAGVEIGAIGIAANDRALFNWAIAAYRRGIDQITPEGTLPEEMRRGQRALHYHLYAAAPLVYLAEFGEDNGLDLYAERDHALQHLVKRAIDGLVDNSYFTQQSGVKQDAPNGAPTAEEIGWAALYVKRFPDATISALLAKAPSLSYMYLGGLPPS